MNSDELKQARDKLIPISNGNPGAITVLAQLYFSGISEQFSYVDALVKLNIVGVDIWLMYKNDCEQNIEKMKILIQEKTMKKT